MKFFKSTGDNIPWRIKACWDKFATIRQNLNYSVTHIYRDGNSIADMLVKLHVQRVWIWGCPEFLHDKLYSYA